MRRRGDRLTVAMWPSAADTDNPYLSRLCSGLAGEGVRVLPLRPRQLPETDLIHLHWPDLIVNRRSLPAALRGAVALLVLVAGCRLTGRPTVWTVHNLLPHEPAHPRLERLFWRLFDRLLGGYLSLTAAGIPLIRQEHPGLAGKPCAVVPHGSYQGSYPRWTESAQAARRLHKLPEAGDGLLFLGQVRRYKGVSELLAAFADLDRGHTFMAVAGQCQDSELADRLRGQALADPRVVLELSRVPDAQLASWFAATSGTVLPFSAGFNSGSVFLSLTMGRPVLVPATAVFCELAEQVGSQWVHCYRDLTAQVLGDFLTAAVELAGTGAEPDLRPFAWPRLAAETAAFYRGLLPAARASR